MAEAGSAGLGGPGGPKPKIGPEPTLLSRTQVDALYKILSAVTEGLDRLRVPYIMTGGSLLGAIRQKSILFCDDDIDLAIVEESSNSGYYELVRVEAGASGTSRRLRRGGYVAVGTLRRVRRWRSVHRGGYVEAGILRSLCRGCHGVGMSRRYVAVVTSRRVCGGRYVEAVTSR
ncbi:hypothetical protein THAOC_31664 [Thalassiosira oceanica]|uniref:LicD family protein n=1 Tax=Thalassiosira oceanica TaxID=159749 RepID=K0RKM2_THAOC|nr:hypothetical protein THAOC_31664 [Thalassiosira oceanica]|eukprot:EJK49461.1 hypothetical protein THAOC_31664 [Thalassiosira oceanica]